MTDVSYEFEVTTEPPVDRRPRGAGRPRTNPFDEAVRQSYVENWAEQISDDAPRGKWFVLRDITTKQQANKIEAQIRGAASYWKAKLGEPVGSNVHWDPDEKTIKFRGCEASQGDKASAEGTPDDVTEGDTDEATEASPTPIQDATIRGEELEHAPA